MACGVGKPIQKKASVVFSKQDQVWPVLLLRQKVAKNTSAFPAARGNVMESPGGPYVVHLRVNKFFQLLAWLKVGNFLRGDKDFLTGFGVAAFP